MRRLRWCSAVIVAAVRWTLRLLVDAINRGATGDSGDVCCARGDCPLYRFGTCRRFDAPDCLQRIESEMDIRRHEGLR